MLSIGDRGHKLAKVIIQGNKYFDRELLRGRMQVQAGEPFFSMAGSSHSLLNRDIRGLSNFTARTVFAR